MTELLLPWPPSLNQCYRTHNGRVLISKSGRQYRELIANLAMINQWPKFGTVRLRVEIEAYPPDKRNRDLDNLFKILLDSLEKAGIYSDDNQIDDLQIIRGEVGGGFLKVWIEEI